MSRAQYRHQESMYRTSSSISTPDFTLPFRTTHPQHRTILTPTPAPHPRPTANPAPHPPLRHASHPRRHCQHRSNLAMPLHKPHPHRLRHIHAKRHLRNLPWPHIPGTPVRHRPRHTPPLRSQYTPSAVRVRIARRTLKGNSISFVTKCTAV